MSLTGFNRARRFAAEQTGKPFDETSYDEANEILQQPDLDLEEEEEGEPTQPMTPRDARIAELKSVGWSELKEILASYDLSTEKPKDSSWNDYAIPLILKHEGLE